MAGWREGLTWDAGALSSSASELQAEAAQLRAVRAGFASAQPSGWQGRASGLAGARRRLLVDRLDDQIDIITKASSAYSNCAGSLRPIQSDMRYLVSYAGGRQYRITDDGGIDSLATGWAQADPRRAYWRSRIWAGIKAIAVRLTAMDGLFAGRLGFLVAEAVVDQGTSWAADKALDAGDWINGKIDDGLDWADEQWDEHVQPRLDAFDKGFDRFTDAAGTKPRWLEDLLTKGEMPQVAEVLGYGAYMGGLLVGSGMNAATGTDHRFFDDGVPYSGTPESVPVRTLTGPSDLMRDMQDIYSTSNPAVDTDRPAIRVTVVENPGEPPRYIVAIPGTSTGLGHAGWFGNDEGTDWAADLKGVGTGNTAATQAVMDAIDKVRAQRGDTGTPEVLLTGHSQGGIIAGNIAANPEFTSRYNVGGIMSAGSPVNTLPIPSTVPVLNFANRYDPVAAIDFGGRNIDGSVNHQPNVNDVIMRSEPREVSPMNSHGQQTYVDKINDIMRPGQSQWVDSEDAVHRWNEQVNRFYPTGSSTTTAYQIDIGRQPR